MDVMIHELVSQIRALDSSRGLSKETLEWLVQAVCDAMDRRESHRERVRSETNVRGYGGGDSEMS